MSVFAVEPRVVRAHWELGRLPAEELPDMAVRFLEAGLDGPCLRELAGLVRPNRSEVLSLAASAFEEAGANELGPVAAAWIVARKIAAGILAGEVLPHNGAKEIGQIARTSPELGSLNIFAGLASEWEDDLAHRADYDAAIREEALTLTESA